MKITIETHRNGDRTEWHVSECDIENLRDLLHASAFLFAQIVIQSGEEGDIAFALGLAEGLLKSSSAFLAADRRSPGPTLKVVEGRYRA